jgi:hypothetical protein
VAAADRLGLGERGEVTRQQIDLSAIDPAILEEKWCPTQDEDGHSNCWQILVDLP